MASVDSELTDTAVLAELGQRLAAARVRARLTQAELAEEAGIGLATVRRLEAGHAVGSDRLVRVLRVLRLLPGLDQLVPAPAPSPLEAFDRAGAVRRRVRKPSSNAAPPVPWTWDDD